MISMANSFSGGAEALCPVQWYRHAVTEPVTLHRVFHCMENGAEKFPFDGKYLSRKRVEELF